MAKETRLIILLFDIASAQEVPFGIPQYIQYILHGLTSAVPFMVIVKSVDLKVVHDGFLF